MIWIFVVILLFLMLIFLAMAGRKLDFSEPVFLLIGSMLLSSFFVFLNGRNWNVHGEFNFLTLIILVTSIFVFIIGDLFSKSIYKLLPKRSLDMTGKFGDFHVSRATYVLSVLFMIFSGVYYFLQLHRSSGIPIGNFISFMTAIRPLLKENLVSISFISTQLFSISKAIAYVYTYMFIWNLIKLNNRQLQYLVIPLLYLMMSLLTSGRIYLIYYAIFVFTLYFVLASKDFNYSFKAILKIILLLFGGVFALFAVFGLLANIVGRNTQHTLFEQISVYVGGPMISFAQFLNHFDYQDRPAIFGEETLVGIYHLLNTLGITTFQANRHLEFIQFGDNWGNIYTALRRYIHDYGVLNSFLIMTVLGALYGFFHEVAINKVQKSMSHIIYCMLLFPVPMIIIDDTFMSTLLSLNTVYDLFYLIVFYSFLAYRSNYYFKTNTDR